MGTYGPPTSGDLRDYLAGVGDGFIHQVEKVYNLLSPLGQLNNFAASVRGEAPPPKAQPRHLIAHLVHAHTNTDAYGAGEATSYALGVVASDGEDAPEAATAAAADIADAQGSLAAAADAKNVVSETTEEATATAAKPSEPDTGASGSGEGGCSFSPSTRVLLAHGKTEAIASVKPGDKVEAADPHTGKHRGPRTVQHVWINHDHDLLDVAIRTRDGHTATLHTTANHPFWDDTTHSWVPAGELHRGDALNTAGNGHVYVVTTHITPGTANRWNLTVQQLHTYYVLAGTTPVLVHNTNAACRIPAGQPGGGRYARDPNAAPRTHTRDTEYPSQFRESTWDEMAALWQDPDTGDWLDEQGNIIPPGDLTFDHIEPVVEHWNGEGYDMSRADRNDWYNDPANLRPMSGKLNSSLGAQLSSRYRQDVGSNYSG